MSEQPKETLINVSSTRSVGAGLGRRFSAGVKVTEGFRRDATGCSRWLFPALKGRAKFIPTLPVESI